MVPRPSRLSALKVALCAGLLAGWTAAAQNPLPAPPDRIQVDRRNHVLELAWSDTEERLQGSIQPDLPHDGEPLKVLLNVGSFAGTEFNGPVTITLREAGATNGPTVTVKREKGAVNWRAEFTPDTAGPYQLDVSFRTTRLKVLHADFEITTRPVPRYILWTMVGLFSVLALAFGIRNLLRKDPASEPQPPVDSAPPPEPQKPSTL